MNYIFDILAYLMPTKSVDWAVNAITKASERLLRAEASQIERSKGIELQIGFLMDEKEVANQEAARDRRIADKLADLTA